MNSGDPQIAATAKAFSDEMGGLAEAFGVYAQRWDPMSIRQDWTGFGHETNEIIAALSSRGHVTGVPDFDMPCAPVGEDR